MQDTSETMVSLADRPVLADAAAWFAEKWSVPVQAYRQSTADAVSAAVPSWYVCLCDGKIVAGIGGH